MGNVVPIKEGREAPASRQSRMETRILTVDDTHEWHLPPCQRELRVNKRVEALAERMKADPVIEGVITLGKITKDPLIYLVDGQQRRKAFEISGVPEVIADIRLLQFKDMKELSEEFVRLNSSLVKMQPDDILRGMESFTPALSSIRAACGFVGYGSARRKGYGPVLSMSAVIRTWALSASDTPATVSGRSVADIAAAVDALDVEHLTGFLNIAHAAWGRDREYYRLWGGLNLTICMWLWRRLVIDRDRPATVRYILMSIAEFKHCLMAVSADSDYVAWLVGRMMGDRERSPCYSRLKTIFARRLSNDGQKKAMLPAPAWSSMYIK